MTASDEAKKALEGVTPATEYDGDPCGCAWCGDADAKKWFMAEAICDGCLDAKHIEALLAEIAAKDAEIARMRGEFIEATDENFIWGAMDNVHDAETTMADYAAAVSRAQRAALKGDTHE